MDTIAAPLVPPELDLQDFPYLPLDIRALQRSKEWLICKRKPALGFSLVSLWISAWQSIPAGSLPDSDPLLAECAGLGLTEWLVASGDLLRSWKRCESDGRLYHPYLAERALIAWAAKLARRGKFIRRLEMESGVWEAIRAEVFKRDDFTCRYCGERGGRLECDHVVPLSRGGKTELTNLTTACFDCNRSKGPKLLGEWLQ